MRVRGRRGEGTLILWTICGHHDTFRVRMTSRISKLTLPCDGLGACPELDPVVNGWE